MFLIRSRLSMFNKPVAKHCKEGSAVISGTHEETDKINVLIEAGTFNVKTKTCVRDCQTCIGYTDYWATPAPMGLAVGASSQMSAIGQWHTGAQFNVTGSSDWSSNAPSIATVSAGMVQGMAAGSTNVVAMFTTTLQGTACGTLEGCPIDDTMVDEPPVNVTPIITSISPTIGLVGNTVDVTIVGTGFGSSPGVTVAGNITASNIQVNAQGTQITAKLAIPANSQSGGDQAVTVSSQGQNSNNDKKFHVQVPAKLARLNILPGAPSGIGPLVQITNGNVVDLNGTIVLSGTCGSYRNFAFDIEESNNISINGTYTFTEAFSNYSTTVSGLTAPLNKGNNFNRDGNVTDIQFFGNQAPFVPRV